MTWEIRDGIARSNSRFFSNSRSDFATRMKVRDHLCLSRVNCRGISLLQFSCLVMLPAFSEMLAKVTLFFLSSKSGNWTRTQLWSVFATSLWRWSLLKVYFVTGNPFQFVKIPGHPFGISRGSREKGDKCHCEALGKKVWMDSISLGHERKSAQGWKKGRDILQVVGEIGIPTDNAPINLCCTIAFRFFFSRKILAGEKRCNNSRVFLLSSLRER